MSSGGSEKYVAVLSKRLLEGWTLLAENCPNCTIPLVRSKQGAIYCVKCEMYCLKENEVPASYTVSQPTPSQMQASPSTTPTAKQTPKVKAEKHQNTIALDYDDDMDDWKPPSEEEMAQIEARRRKNDTHSAAIAKKLLEGWILLNDCCPNRGCTVPLIKNRNNQLFCVSCNSWIPVDSDTIPTPPDVKPKGKPIENAITQTNPAQPSKTQPPHQKQLNITSAQTLQAQPPSPASAQFSAKGQREIAAASIAAMYTKLDFLRTHLNSVQDLNETKTLLVGINDCLSGIQKLKEIHAMQ